jgi:neutral ceramidase
MGACYAGASQVDITPENRVWMDGMIRVHPSEGVHDRIAARAVVFANTTDCRDGCALVSVEVCALARDDTDRIRHEIERRTGISKERIMICATHAHSGPATFGFFNPKEVEYTAAMGRKIVEAVASAAGRMTRALVEHGSAEERSISHYRRLLSDDCRVIMNWEPFPSERIRGPLGKPDPEIVLLRFRAAGPEAKTIAALFHHAGHPNTLSGENYLITSEYPGLASRLLEERWGGEALYLNGAQGSVDIDNFHDRGWEGLERLGAALAAATSRAWDARRTIEYPRIWVARSEYMVRPRSVTRRELRWADDVLNRTRGEIQPVADGVGDDFKATLIRRLYDASNSSIPVEQVGFAIGDCALISFPGELYTEVGMELKRRSPFPCTLLVGLTNGYIGYVPTRKAIKEGGYAEEMREVDKSVAAVVLRKSLALLGHLWAMAGA